MDKQENEMGLIKYTLNLYRYIKNRNKPTTPNVQNTSSDEKSLPPIVQDEAIEFLKEERPGKYDPEANIHHDRQIGDPTGGLVYNHMDTIEAKGKKKETAL